MREGGTRRLPRFRRDDVSGAWFAALEVLAPIEVDLL